MYSYVAKGEEYLYVVATFKLCQRMEPLENIPLYVVHDIAMYLSIKDLEHDNCLLKVLKIYSV